MPGALPKSAVSGGPTGYSPGTVVGTLAQSALARGGGWRRISAGMTVAAAAPGLLGIRGVKRARGPAAHYYFPRDGSKANGPTDAR